MFLFEATGIMADTSVRPLAVQAKAGEMHEKGWVARIGSSYFCVYKGIADGVCHLGATSLTSTLPAYSCELTGRLKLALQGTKCPPSLHCPRSASPFPNPCPNPSHAASTAQNTSCPGWVSTSLVCDVSLPRPRCLPFHINFSSISLNTLEMLSWCEHKGLPYPPEPEGDRWRREVWRNILPLQCPRRRLEWTACGSSLFCSYTWTSHRLHWRRGQENLLPFTTQAGSALTSLLTWIILCM